MLPQQPKLLPNVGVTVNKSLQQDPGFQTVAILLKDTYVSGSKSIAGLNTSNFESGV